MYTGQIFEVAVRHITSLACVRVSFDLGDVAVDERGTRYLLPARHAATQFFYSPRIRRVARPQPSSGFARHPRILSTML